MDKIEFSLSQAVFSSACVVLLGAPGSGKTTDMQQIDQLTSSPVQYIHLGGFQSQDRLARFLTDGPAVNHIRSGGSGTATFAVDSLDELPQSMASFCSILDNEFAPLAKAGMRLVIACRSAAWNSLVASSLLTLYGELNVFELAPFNVSEVTQLLTHREIDPGRFWNAVSDGGVQALTEQPITLELLIGDYLSQLDNAQELKLPTSQEELYARSCRRLLREPNKARSYADTHRAANGSMPAAQHLATLSLFSGRAAFRLPTVSETAANRSALAVADIAPAGVIEKLLTGGRSLTVLRDEDIVQTLSTALFRGAAQGIVTWQHQTLQEYLAATYLASLGSAPLISRALFKSDESRIPPQLQAVGAWLIALNSEGYQDLLNGDPEAFLRSGLELRDPKYRRVLVEKLLDLADRYELREPVRWPPVDVAFDGLATLLCDAIADGSATIDKRYLALQILRFSRLADCVPFVADLALGAGTPYPLRSSAGCAVVDLTQKLEVLRRLTPLLYLSHEEDPDDELYGVGLAALHACGEPIDKLLGWIRNPRNPDLYGNYALFTRRTLPDAFTQREIESGELERSIEWATERRIERSDRVGVFDDLDDLMDAITIRALRQLGRGISTITVAQYVFRTFLAKHRLFDDSTDRIPDLLAEDRRSLVLALAEVSTQDSGEVMTAIVCVQSSVVDDDDFPWLAEQLSSATELDGTERFWQAAVRNLYDPNDDGKKAVLKRLSGRSRYISWLLEPPTLEMESIDELDVEAESERKLPTESDIRAAVNRSLAAADANDKLPGIVHYLQFEPGKAISRREFNLRIDSMPGWPLLSYDEQEAVADVARWHLENADIDRFHDIHPQTVVYREFDGVRALVLLGDEAPWLSEERAACWLHAAAISPSMHEQSELLGRVMRRLFIRARELAIEVVDSVVRAQGSMAVFTLRRLDGLTCTQETFQWLTQLVTDTSVDPDVSAEAFSLTLNANAPAGESVLAQLLFDQHQQDRLDLLCAVALQVSPVLAWRHLHAEFRADMKFAERVLLKACDRHQISLDLLSESDLIELWDLFREVFPGTGDDVVFGAHFVGPRESAGRIRDSILPRIADRGTAEAVRILEDRAAKSQEPLMLRYASIARDRRRQSNWEPVELRDVQATISAAISALQSSTRPRFWNSYYAAAVSTVALLSSAIVGIADNWISAPAVGSWLVLLSMASATLVWGRRLRGWDENSSLPKKPASWPIYIGGAGLAVAILLLPVVVLTFLVR